MNKYFNDAIIGNKNITASFTKKGELLRLFYPSTDYRQFIDFFHVGIRVNDSSLIKLHDDVNNTYNQYYTEGTNILNTEICNSYFNLYIKQTDFIAIKENILIKKYKFINKHNINLDINFLIYSKLLTDDNNQASGMYKEQALIQYMHDYTLCIFSKNSVLSSQINNNEANIEDGIIGDKDYIGMSSDSSISYDLGVLKPNEEKEIVIMLYLNNEYTMNQIKEKLIELKKINIEKELEVTKKYWQKYLKEHNTITIPTSKIKDKIEKIYKRTILLYPLLSNETTGGISAAVEIDEKRTKCGRYSYCWPRDGIFITEAMDILKMTKETEKFYKNFCKNTQNKDGMWEQRFYTDCNLAPSWGYQIDETASVVYGVYNHFKHIKDKKFLKDNLKMCEKAISFLKKYIDEIFEKKEETDIVKKEILEQRKKEKMTDSYDIWEENEGIHTYSLATIFASFNSMIEIYKEINVEFKDNRLKLEKIIKESQKLEEYKKDIKNYILNNLYNTKTNTFIRNEDQKVDISLLGLAIPFDMFSAKEKKIQNTVERINLTLRTYTGGYLRYENDNYVGGNPWVIATLWMVLYYIKIKDYKSARQCFKYIVESSSELGFLGEQVDNKTMQPAWVIGLGWSHAMFILALKNLF